MRQPVSGAWSRLYFDALASIGRAAERGIISKDECRRQIAAIDDWLTERNIAIVADTETITKHQLRFVPNPRAR